ncbi:hypothetical protein AB0F03_36750 [Streptomyces sp. NPDC028722]|uniref:hypothetical protein n=1 Tax=Streptomyces sp. NPDC028722 TaxID=3155016 RepID=UPI00340100E7
MMPTSLALIREAYTNPAQRARAVVSAQVAIARGPLIPARNAALGADGRNGLFP